MLAEAWAIARLRSVPASARAVLNFLSLCQQSGGGAYPSVEGIATACGVSARTARRAVRFLEKSELVLTVRRPGRASVYRIRADKLEAGAALQVVVRGRTWSPGSRGQRADCESGGADIMSGG